MQQFFYTLLLGCIFMACGNDGADYSDVERPHDPWVFRSVLDGKPRMVTLGLNDDLWVTYNAQNGALHKAWKGGVNFDGAVYTTVHGPQPSTLGDSWLENTHTDKPFEIITGGASVTPEVQYKGHKYDGGQAYLMYELTADGATVSVTERPEYVRNDAGQVGLERTFFVDGLPGGAQLAVNGNVSSVATETGIDTDAEFVVKSKERRQGKGVAGLDIDGQLLLENGESRFTTYFVSRPLLANNNKVVGAEDEEQRPLGYRLIARSDCKSCHNQNVKTIGPAYVDVAKRYANNDKNVAMLVKKVQMGGAGNWGETVMSAHPNLSEADIKPMITYIMGLDAEQEAEMVALQNAAAPLEDLDLAPAATNLDAKNLAAGAAIRVMLFDKDLEKLADVDWKKEAIYEGTIPQIGVTDADVAMLPNNFAVDINGYLNIPKDNNYVFRLRSDDGSRLTIDGNDIITHDGLHGPSPKDGEIALSKGFHPFRIEFFQGGGGKNIRLEWRPFGSGEFVLAPEALFYHNKAALADAGENLVQIGETFKLPGDRAPVPGVHPAYDLSQARPETFLPKVGGMDFLPDGRMVLSTWDPAGSVYVLDNVNSGEPRKIGVKRIAQGLAEPLGVQVTDDGTIYVLQKQELTRLVDTDGDDLIDEYQTVANGWTVSNNFHEFAFGLVEKDGYLYATLAIGIMPGGASANPQPKDRGKAVRIDPKTGEFKILAHGLRTPNGIGLGVDNEIFVADNQGDWLPASKVVHVKEGAFYGSRAVPFPGMETTPMTNPVVWLPQDEIGNSPSTPLALNDGPYKGQMIHGEVTHGGLKRDFVEKVDGEYQGAVFRFTQGLEAGVNRSAWGPDGSLYIGGVGSTGNWGHAGKLWYGLQRLKYNDNVPFEMLAVRAKSNGVEIEFTQPLDERSGWEPEAYTVQQWRYVPTADYGGPKVDLQNLDVLSASVSDDRRKVFLELAGMQSEHVVYLRLPNDWTSDTGSELWSTEAWYTMNRIPAGQPGTVRSQTIEIGANTLTPAERAAGWKLLFDGKTTEGWRNYLSGGIGEDWKVIDGALTLDAKKDEQGTWQVSNGGTIITEDQYENYELQLEWKIGECGNSGIIFHVQEDEQYKHAYDTGAEMQVLDNNCHPDAKYALHRAGDLYDMIEARYPMEKTVGQWNKVRLISDNGRMEFWLNGRQVVEFEIGSSEWRRLIKRSKFAKWPGFMKVNKGHIALQDHNDRVSYRNIKIRELKGVEM